VPTRSLIWCVVVRPDALVGSLNLATNQGWLVVDEFMAVPGADGIYACGDCAAVPDLTRPGQVCGMTAQHATRQGRLVARNVAASFGPGDAQPYKHYDLGFLVDLGGLAAAANPLHIPLSGPPANAVTRAYHLYDMSREPGQGARRLGAERSYRPGGQLIRCDQRRIRPAGCDPATRLTRLPGWDQAAVDGEVRAAGTARSSDGGRGGLGWPGVR
jgi:hypothetical protein